MFQKNNINQCSNMGITTSYLDYGENPNKRMSPYSRNINRSLKSCYIERNHAHRPCPSNLCLMDSLENYQSEADINQKKGPLGGKNQVTGNPKASNPTMMVSQRNLLLQGLNIQVPC